jgi:hypothetical protein
MSLRVVGIVLLLLGSLAIGIGFGELCFRLFVSAVPRVEMSKFNAGSAHVAYILYGAGFGVAIFLWSLVAIALARVFGKRKAAPDVAPGAAPTAVR